CDNNKLWLQSLCLRELHRAQFLAAHYELRRHVTLLGPKHATPFRESRRSVILPTALDLRMGPAARTNCEWTPAENRTTPLAPSGRHEDSDPGIAAIAADRR